jgi:hypothetical protein
MIGVAIQAASTGALLALTVMQAPIAFRSVRVLISSRKPEMDGIASGLRAAYASVPAEPLPPAIQATLDKLEPKQ